jgi:hypothetical protein
MVIRTKYKPTPNTISWKNIWQIDIKTVYYVFRLPFQLFEAHRTSINIPSSIVMNFNFSMVFVGPEAEPEPYQNSYP